MSTTVTALSKCTAFSKAQKISFFMQETSSRAIMAIVALEMKDRMNILFRCSARF